MGILFWIPEFTVMRHLYIFFIILIIGGINSASAAEAGNPSISMDIPQQDTLGTARRPEKRAVEKDKKESLSPTENTLKTVPKAKNKAIPRTIGSTSINVKSPRINPVKVKVNTQVKIKL